MKLIHSALLCSLLATTALTVRADQEYAWTGGASGFEGVIVLDSNSNSAGTLADIVNAAIITPQGTFFFNPSEALLLSPNFAWDPAQITNMELAWVDSPFIAAIGEDGPDVGGLNFVASIPPSTNADAVVGPQIDFTGSWLAVPSSVPDGASTGLLVALGVAGLALASRKKILSA
jgi:hypothetical protein